MCGIVGFAKQDSLKDLYEGLKTLEYRGYDSAGVAYVDHGNIVVRKRKGRVERLRAFLFGHRADVCMGHTRWATHGAPTATNAHPHVAGRFAVVHNGIITNYASLKAALTAKGRRFASHTDTEVIAHLLDENMQGDVVEAIRRTAAVLEGNWAVAVLYAGTPDSVYLFKKGNPLIVGKGQDFCCFASDTPALVRYTRQIYKMRDGEIACIRRCGVTFWAGAEAIEPAFVTTTLQADEVERGEYPSFMYKEMVEIPQALVQTADFLRRTAPKRLPLDGGDIVLTGCGTAYHACLYMAELGLGRTVRAVVASEFDPAKLGIGKGSLVVAVSQSGETADTLEAVRRSRAAGAEVWGITNVPYSGLTTAVDHAVLTKAGAEIAVAATKSYAAQLLALRYLFGDIMPVPDVDAVARSARDVWRRIGALDAVAKCKFDNVFLLAKGIDYVTALEGALKIKEVAYLPCETCYAGEIKHGPLACVGRRTLVVGVSTQGYGDKMRTALNEVTTRGAKTLVISSDSALSDTATWGYTLPQIAMDSQPFLTVLPLQYLAYRMATARGLDADKPRNLAKSVTVE